MIRLEPLFAELATMTNFSFLRGASHPEEMVARAAELGLAGIGVADRNTLAGVVRAHVFARENKAALAGMRVVVGARLAFDDGTPDILAYPKDRAAYGRLCRILTVGNLRAEKGECHLRVEDLIEHGEGLQIVALPPLSPCGRGIGGEGSGAPAPRASALRRDPSSVAASPRPLLPQGEKGAFSRLREAFGKRLWIGASLTYGEEMRGALARRAALARTVGAPLLATNDALMHAPERRALADVLSCIREKTTLEAAGRLTQANAERHLKAPREMARLFAEAPSAIEETICFLDGLAFSLDELAHRYPEELRQGFATPQAALEAFAIEGARTRYPEGVPERVREALRHELALIASLAYAPYFLTVHDIVRFARSRGILCQGRGSAANSAVCFCLGITEVDPARFDLLFERFVSPERNEPPDIDVDFEHERREEVIQYIYRRYGRERAGLAAAVTTYRTRSAIRETAKVFGLSDDVITTLNGAAWGHGSSPIGEADARAVGLDPADPTLSLALKMADELAGFPRHLTQHSGGFVITRDRLDEVVPVMNAAMEERTTIEWDKDDLDALGLLKIDVLALGMLTALSKGLDLLSRHYGERLSLATIPPEEVCVYAMIQRADTIGVFQIESRAQMSMLPRLKPEKFYDLVIEVAIVRPGPIQGDMVHPYLRRRQGLEEVVYPSRELEAVLKKTLGVPLFQEQAMKIAIVAAGFAPSEADKLRRAMATFRRVGTIKTFEVKMIEGMAARGYDRGFAERCFRQIEGFGEYGFPESHAASFALLVYASCWMKCRYPDVFAAAMLNSQPLGFYAPAQLVRDAREHGVEMREVDVNLSDWDCTLEALPPLPGLGERVGVRGRADLPDEDGEAPHPSPSAISSPRERGEGIHPRHASMAPFIRATHAVRLGLRQIVGVKEDDMRRLVEQRGLGYDSVRDLWLRSGWSSAALEKLADADAFRSIGLDRRQALWAVRGLDKVGDQDDLPLFSVSEPTRETEPDAKLPPMPLGAHVVEDYRRLSLSLKAHPTSFMRARLSARGILRSDALAKVKSGERVTVAGLVLVRQRPGTAKGVIFMTLEDEAGVANVIVWPKAFERLRAIVLGARFVATTGKLQSEQGVIHIVADRMEDLTSWLGLLSEAGGQIDATARADEANRPQLAMAQKRQGNRFAQTPRLDAPRPPSDLASEIIEARRAMPAGRNFR
ncbi:MAG TPA: error-prone DNA polymerase [Roseiarcus sp.]|nr:error-prone DNA polymerase [Roseiarcus sp.]